MTYTQHLIENWKVAFHALHDFFAHFIHGLIPAIKIRHHQPDIIRCKDCEFWTKQKNSIQGRCALHKMYPSGNWYCGTARRRGERNERIAY